MLKTYLERPTRSLLHRPRQPVCQLKNSAGEDWLFPTQIGRALQELIVITAYSPQAKGRVERSFGTAQDRLVKGLRVAVEQANPTCEFLPWWNATFAGAPAHPDEAHRELGPEHDLDSALSHVETRRVANDCTIRFRGKSYQIDRKAIVPGLRNSRVRVERRLDGVLAARFGKHRTGAEALRRAAPIGAPAAQERPGGTRCGSGREGWRQSLPASEAATG